MGVFTDALEKEVRLEYMRPEEVSSAKEQAPYIYVPFGSIEWHGYHNVLGLDAVKAHEQLVGLAARAGGIVYPAVFFGSGGGHLGWPSTFMFSPEPLITLVVELLKGFEADGYEKAILLSGHYPNRSRFLDSAIDEYRQSGGQMDVLALVENQAKDVGGDHAAKFETSFMLYLHPDTVDVERLNAGPTDDYGGADENINYMADEYRGHPCYGLAGIDPRPHASAAVGRKNTENLLAFLEEWLAGEAR
ncbi:creatininase family protein [Verrucomicrobiota bacterium]